MAPLQRDYTVEAPESPCFARRVAYNRTRCCSRARLPRAPHRRERKKEEKKTRQNPKNKQVEPLSPSVLTPIIDLAYWSNFVEVRRDAAGALAALAMNAENLPMMAQAGTLGALLALLGDGDLDERTDGECVRCATLALSKLVTVRESSRRFVQRRPQRSA